MYTFNVKNVKYFIESFPQDWQELGNTFLICGDVKTAIIKNRGTGKKAWSLRFFKFELVSKRANLSYVRKH